MLTKKTKREMIIALVLTMICLIFWFAVEVWKGNIGRTQTLQEENYAVLTLGKEENIIDLDENKVYDFMSNNIPVHIEVRDRKVAFVHSECKDHICERYGWLEKKGDLAVCLPAQASLSIR